jgi:hypothetical protein
MAAVTAFFDASGSPGDTTVVSLAGLVSTAERWAAFAEEWQQCLEAFGVSALHMKHFAHSEGEFSSWKDDEPKRRRLLSALLYAIENHIDYTAAVSVWMKDYNATDKHYRLSEFMRPYTLGASTCVSSILRWARASQLDAGGIAYIFEEGDTDQSDVSRCWRALFAEYNVSPIFLKKVDRFPGSEISAPIRPFEAADLVAYENLKANKSVENNRGTLPFEKLRRPMQRMSKLPGAAEWRLFDLRDLAATCEAYLVPRRT